MFYFCLFKSSSLFARDSFFSISFLSFNLSDISFSSLAFPSSSLVLPFSLSRSALYAKWADLTDFFRSCVIGVISTLLETRSQNLTASLMAWRSMTGFSLGNYSCIIWQTPFRFSIGFSQYKCRFNHNRQKLIPKVTICWLQLENFIQKHFYP